MEINFSVETRKPELITKEEYPLFWCGDRNTATPDNIGLCKVKVEGNKVMCSANITTGGIRHSINDVVTAEFKPVDTITGKYEHGILFKDDNGGREFVYGFCLSIKIDLRDTKYL
ncbi:MAG: hypothetical protein WDO19_32125 [Bacteroidota bacterium]